MSYIFCLFKSILLCLLFIPSTAQAASSKTQANPLIVLFHGLNNNAASFDAMQKALEQAFPTASVVALTSVEEGMQSVALPIEEQNKLRFEELSSRVEDLKDRPILLIGHSQGGVAAYAFIKRYQDCLNIKGLVALAAPWEGAPGARVDAAMLEAHLTAPILQELRAFSRDLVHPKIYLEEQLRSNVEANQAVCLYPGGKALMEGSSFLRKVETWLANEQLPILVIGGGQSDFRALLPEGKNKKRKYRAKVLNDMYTFFVVGEKDAHNSPNNRHDMQVPLYSQHALRIVDKSSKNFKRVFIKDAFHSTHVLMVPVPKDKAILSHPRALGKVIAFTENIFK